MKIIMSPAKKMRSDEDASITPQNIDLLMFHWSSKAFLTPHRTYS